MDDGLEGRALLLYLGDVLEAIARAMKCADWFNTVGEAVGREDSLMGFTILRMIDVEMTPFDFAWRATSGSFLWPKALLDESINRLLLANLVQHDLPSGHQSGWDAYEAERRQEVPWIGEHLDGVSEPGPEPGNDGITPAGFLTRARIYRIGTSRSAPGASNGAASCAKPQNSDI